MTKQSAELSRKKPYGRPSVIYAGVLSVRAGSPFGEPRPSGPDPTPNLPNPFDPADIFGKKP